MNDTHATLTAAPAVRIKKLYPVEPGNERALMEAVAHHGPLSIGIDAACVPFRFYTSGVLDTEECSMDPWNIDHAVLLVGYGEDDGAPRLQPPCCVCKRMPGRLLRCRVC